MILKARIDNLLNNNNYWLIKIVDCSKFLGIRIRFFWVIIKMAANKPKWHFRCFIDHREICLVCDAIKPLSKTAKANMRVALQILSFQDKTEWNRPHASSIKNHIYVIRFKDENRTQHRLFGHFHDDRKCFVMSLKGTEKGNKYEPANYNEIAAQRKGICDSSFDRAEKCFVN